MLKSGQSLRTGEEIFSPQLNVKLTMSRQGDLVLTRQCDAEFIWFTFTDNDDTDHPAAVTMQEDGNLAIYNSKKVLVWDSGTAGREFAGADLRVNNDGTLCIAKNGSRCLWTSGGYGLCDPFFSKQFDGSKEDGATAMLHSMRTKTMWVAPDGANLRLSDDCILCVYKNGICLWTSSGRTYACSANNSDGEARLTANDDKLLKLAQSRQFTHGKSSDLLPQEVLESGEALSVGQSLWSPGRSVQLKMERTGNLTIYRQCDNKSIWSSATSGTDSNPRSVVMQENGNLAIYNGEGLLVWSSGTFQPLFRGAKLRLEDKGSLCIYTQGECLWESGGFGLCEPAPSPAFQNGTVILNPGDSLNRGDFFTSNTQKGSCSLSAQADGKLVLVRSCDDTVVFSIRHGAGFSENLGWDEKASVYSFDLTDDGDLAVTYDDSVRHTFRKISSLFNGSADIDLRMNDDCRMCVFDNGSCLWTAHAVTYPCPLPITTPTKAYQEVEGGLTVRLNGNLMLSRICDDAAIFSVRHGVGFTDNLEWSQDAYVGGFSLDRFGNLIRSYRDKTFMLYSFNDIWRLFNDTATGANLRLRSDCRMCLFKAGACLWTAHAFTYPCSGGTVALTETENRPLTGSPTASVGVGVGCAVIVLLIIGLLMWFYGRRQLQARRKGWMYKNNRGVANAYTLDLADLGGDNNELKAVCSEYVALFNVPMDNLELDDVILGKGKFGIVYKGVAHDLPTVSKSPVTVAAKMLTGSAEGQKLQFAGEVETMSIS
ncbi:hypothetical protein BV898_06318 [Hypsibius exemplaris]|uniref:Bulb-type lectin domain-containing protein n=1 Tax=Hypsibius exemplaris TaxID=2072580 RepID=A0A1W0WX53_HYPEX|nr:hypothetical protein BV898_06318 [Hypsibius exemplaris]